MKIPLKTLRALIREEAGSGDDSLEPGQYYWIRLGSSAEAMPAYFEGYVHADGSENTMPWSIIGSDEPIESRHVTVVDECTPP